MAKEKSPLFSQLHFRLTIACTLVTGLVLTSMTLVSLFFSETQLQERTKEEFHTSLDSIILYLRDASAIDQGWLSQTETSGNLTIYLEEHGKPFLHGKGRDMQGISMAMATACQQGIDLSNPPKGLLPEFVLFPMGIDGEKFFTAVGTAPVPNGWVGFVVYKPTPQILRLRRLFAVSLFLAFLCLTLFSFFFTNRAIQPILESRKRQMEFVSAAAHEIRSPLAVIQTSADGLQHASPEQMERFARTISGECIRLSRLASDLLTLAGADSQRLTLCMALEEPETLLLTAYENFEPVALRKQIALSVLPPKEDLPRIRCDGQRILQLLSILIENALSYTPAGGSVLLEAEAKDRTLRFHITDNGPGIPDEEKTRIFERFYRADRSRSSREHYGLGLSIAWEIAALHRGSLTVSDGENGGTRFTVTLPVSIKYFYST